jgi:peptidoglycan/LPS O-acetylase OafA/YrhL
MFPLFGPVGQTDAFADELARGFRTLFFGPPAVVAFFLISGFCIHYPYCNDGSRPVSIGRFYARRYIRILAPVIMILVGFKVFIPATVFVGKGTILWNSTLWSIVCEEIYYGAYPFLNNLARRYGWRVLVGVAVGGSLLITYRFFPAREWADIGVVATTLTLLPVWLMGCQLAERAPSMTEDFSARQIWLRRFGAWSMMWVALMLHFHAGIYQTATALWVGIGCYFWLRAEICHYRNRRPWSVLRWSGQWSYSLYLVHPLVIATVYKYNLGEFATRLGWTDGFILVLASSHAFYLLIERPSHNLARKIPMFAPEVASTTLAQPATAGG